jgi:hypothetical protein
MPHRFSRHVFTNVAYRSHLMPRLAAAVLPALLLGTVPAAAADLSMKDEQPAIMAPARSWAGLYFGMQAGGLLQAENDLEPFRNGGEPGAGGGGGGLNGAGTPGTGGIAGDSFGVDADTTYSDALVGLHIGYNWQSGNLVYGVEADIDANNSLDTLLGSLRGRLGWASDRTFVYITAGLAYLSVADSVSNVFLGGDGGSGGDGGEAGGAGGVGAPGIGVAPVVAEGGSGAGFVAGLGVEYRLTREIGLGLEGLYYTFEDDNLGITEDGDFFSVRARLTMHLDRDGSLESLKDSYPVLAHWGGFYIGAHAGAAFDASDDSIDSVDFNAGGAGTGGGDGITNAGGGGGGGGGGGSAVARLDDDLTFIGGLQLGYNIQRGLWVYGLEGDASFGDNEKYSYLASIRARLGYVSGSYLFYATGGVAFAGFDTANAIFASDGVDGTIGEASPDGDGGPGGPGGISGSAVSDEDVVGFVIGAGVEAKLTDRLSLGFEGLYYNLDRETDLSIPAEATLSYAGNEDNDVFVLRGRLSYHLSSQQEPLR